MAAEPHLRLVAPSTVQQPDPGSPVCVTEGCGKERKWRGLCSACYGQARQLIDEGKTTWKLLAEAGLIVMDDKPFVTMFRRAMKARAEAEAASPPAAE